MEPIKRVPIVSQVEESIREMIEKKEYKPGMKLPTEFEFCQTLQVGRGTVREALRLLQAKGLVEIKPGRGAFVAENEPADANPVVWLVQNEKELRDSIDRSATRSNRSPHGKWPRTAAGTQCTITPADT